MDFEKFLESSDTDHQGRSLNDIWAYSDFQIEYTHNFIQLIFPLDKPSRHNFNGLYLDDNTTLERIKANQLAKENVIRSSEWFLGFLARNDQWKARYNHNQLRITRMIESLRLLVSDDQAEHCKSKIFRMVGDKSSINDDTLGFWENA